MSASGWRGAKYGDGGGARGGQRGDIRSGYVRVAEPGRNTAGWIESEGMAGELRSAGLTT